MRTPVGTGWLAREQAAKAALAARDAGHHPIASTDVGQQRAAMLQAQADAAAAAQAEHERRIRETVTVCPCCAGKGHLSILEAAAALESIESYKRVGWHPNTHSIGRVSKDAFTVDKDGRHVAEIVIASGTEADLAAVADVVRESVTAAIARIAPVMTIDDDAAGSDAEALAAIEAETAKSKKAQRRRVAPPFLDGDA